MAIDLSAIAAGKNKPARIIIYGPEGIGKTTFATQTPTPVFLQAEDGLTNESVPRFPINGTIQKFDDLLQILASLGSESHNFKTVVVESLDWIEPLVWSATCKRLGVQTIESPGYGKGYVEADTEWRKLFAYVSALRDLGMTIIMSAHSTVIKVEDPIHPPYDMFTLKLHKRAAGLAKEFSDIIGFCNIETFLKSDDIGFGTKKSRAISTGNRVMYLTNSPAYVAKNRYGMPDVLPLLWNEIETYLPCKNEPLQKQTIKGE